MHSPPCLPTPTLLLTALQVSGEPFIDVAVPFTILVDTEENHQLIAEAKAAAEAREDYGAEELEKDKESCCLLM